MQIKDVSALRAAVDELSAKGIGIDLVANSKPRMYYDRQQVQCDWVVKLPDCQYDVGLEKQEDGSYLPIFDEWQGYIGSQLGAACPMPGSREGRAQHQIGQLMQNYAKHAAINAATARGMIVTGNSVDEEGNIHLTLGGL